MLQPAVVVDDLWESYRAETTSGLNKRGRVHWALRGVSFTVDPGELLGVVGHNGSGKTTLLQTIAGVLNPTRGTVRASGRVVPLVDLAAGANRDLTGREHVLIGGVLLGLRRREVRDRWQEISAFSGLEPEALESAVRTYSAGMGLRLGFALAVNCEPSVLLIDEVLSTADHEFLRVALERIDKLRSEGCAVLLASHDEGVVREHCDTVLVLDHGSVSYFGAPAKAPYLSEPIDR